MELDQFIKFLENFSLPIKGGEEEIDEKIKLVWGSMIKLVKTNPGIFMSLFPLIIEYSRVVKGFVQINPPQISGIINNLETVSEKERMEDIKTIFLVFSFLNIENISIFIHACIKIAQNMVSTLYYVPGDFSGCMELAETSTIDPSIFISCFDLLRSSFDGGDSCGTLIVASFLVNDIVEECEDSLDFFISKIADALRGNHIQQVSGLFLLSKLNHHLAQEETDKHEVLYDYILPLLNSEDENVFQASHKTMVQLAKCGVFSGLRHVTLYLKQFDNYKSEKITRYFKTLTMFLDDYESVPTSIMSPIYDFLVENAAKGSLESQAYCLEVFSLLAAVNKIVLEDTYEAELEIVNKLMETPSSFLLSKAACFLLALSKTIPETFPQIQNSYIPRLTKFLESDLIPSQRKEKLDIAQSISAMIEGGKYPQFSNPIIVYTISALDDAKSSEIIYIGSVVIALRSVFSLEQALTACSKLVSLVFKLASSQDVNMCLHMIKKLMKVHNIDSLIFSNLVDKIISGNIASLNGLHPYISADTKTMIFYFISAFIKKYPLISGNIATTITSWVPYTRIPLLPAVLEAVESSIMASILTPDALSKLYSTIMTLLVTVPIEEEEEYCSVVEILILFVEKYPNICEVKNIIYNATKMLSLCHGVSDSGVETEVIDDTLVLPTLSRLILSTYASTSLNAEITKDLIIGIIEDLPTSSMPDILPIIINMLNQSERFKIVLLVLCRTVTNMLLLSKADIDEIGLDIKLVNDARAVVKEIFKKNKLISRQVMKDFSSSKAKLNKFNSLFN